MLNILLFLHIVVAILLIIVILLQRTKADGISGIGGNNMGIITSSTAADFLTKTTIILATLFIINSLILANLSSRKIGDITNKLELKDEIKDENILPIAK